MSAPQIQYPPTSGGGTPVGGSGTANTIPLWTGSTPSTTLADSLLSQSGAIVTNSGTSRTADGSNTEPGYTFTNSSGSGMYRGTSGTVLRFASSGAFAFGVSASQNVLIGGTATTTPASALHVRNNTAGITLDSTLGSGRQYQLNPLRTGVSNAGFEIRDVTAGAAVIAFDASQQVGIGTASPGGRLDVVGVAGLSWAIRAQVSSANTSPALNAELGLNLKNTSATVGNYTSITNRDSSDNANTQINFINVNNSGSGAINFVTRDSVGGSGERARIDSSGNFGIGIIPSAWASSVRAEEMRTHARWNYNSGSDSVAYWTVNAFLNSAGNAIYKATAAASQYTQIGGAHVWERAVSGTAGNTVTWLESARIDPSGKVGIGTASPGTRLHVLASAAPIAILASSQATQGYIELNYNTSTTFGYIGNGASVISGGAAGDLGLRSDTGVISFATGGNTERARIDSSGVLTTTDLATYNLSGATASVAAGGTSASIFTPAASSSYIVYIQAAANTGVMAHAMVTQNGAGTGALVSVTGSVLCTINNAGGALTITNNSGSAEVFRWRALKLRSLV